MSLRPSIFSLPLPIWSSSAIVLAVLLALGACTDRGSADPGHGPGDDAEQQINDPLTGVRAPTREEVLLMVRMKDAGPEEIRDYIRELLSEELPPEQEIPAYIVRCRTPQEASEAIGERYPAFYGRQGGSLLEAVANDPVAYRSLIRDTRTMRRKFEGHEEQ